MTIPTVETERLILRGHRLDDFPALAALWADPVVTRHIGGRPFDEEESWTRLLRYAGTWALMGYGLWAVEEKDSGRYRGDLGFMERRRAIVPPLDGPEIGWVLAADAAGRGYATEAARAAVAWGDRRFGRRRTCCIIAPGHKASLRVAEKVGYRPTGTRLYQGHPTTILIREAPAAASQPKD